MSVPLFNLGPDITGVYQDGIDTLILTLGQDCSIVCPGETRTCPNCQFDPISRRGTGFYNGTGPAPFADGMCPVCRNSGFDPVAEDLVVVKRFLIQRNVKLNYVLGDGNQTRPRTGARLKGYVKDLPPLLAMKYIVLDFEHQSQMQEKYEAASSPEYSGNIVPGRYFRMYLQRIE